MRNALLLFLFGVIAGAIGFYYVQEHRHRTTPPAPATQPTDRPTQPKTSLVEQARADAKTARDAVAAKLAEWHLTPDEIRTELAQTGQVVRARARAAGETIASTTSNARVVATIKAKYALENGLSARAIDVECHDGHVILRGTAASHALIAKAIALALDTDGVTDVKSQIALPPQNGT